MLCHEVLFRLWRSKASHCLGDSLLLVILHHWHSAHRRHFCITTNNQENCLFFSENQRFTLRFSFSLYWALDVIRSGSSSHDINLQQLRNKKNYFMCSGNIFYKMRKRRQEMKPTTPLVYRQAKLYLWAVYGLMLCQRKQGQSCTVWTVMKQYYLSVQSVVTCLSPKLLCVPLTACKLVCCERNALKWCQTEADGSLYSKSLARGQSGWCKGALFGFSTPQDALSAPCLSSGSSRFHKHFWP